MKNKNVQNKWDREIMFCRGTDIPLLSSSEFGIFARIVKLIEQKQKNILTMDDIFDEYTYTKSNRFDLLARLVKKKVIRRTKMDYVSHLYEIIPKMSFRESKEIRIYVPKTRKERLNLKRCLMMIE